MHNNTNNSKAERQAETKAFLATILPAKGAKCGFLLPERKHFFRSDLDELVGAIHTFNDRGSTVYHGCAVYKKFGSRAKNNAIGACSLWLDVDAGEAKPYPDQTAAVEAVRSFCQKTGLSDPILVDSGYGTHVYWPLDQMLPREEWEAAAQQLKSLCEINNLHADHSRTTDISSVLRPPGTYNRKNPAAPRLVHLIGPVVEPYDTESFLTKIGFAPSLLQPTSSRSIVDAAAAIYSQQPTSAERVAEECAQIARLRDKKGDLPEQLWYAGLCLIAHCDDSERWAHEWSKGHSNYSEAETNKKLEHARRDSGPTTCARFEALNKDACLGCRHKGTIKSPIMLGRANSELPGVDVPRGYRLTCDGVFQHEKKGEVKISGPIWVDGHTRGRLGNGWGHSLKLIDRDGHQQAYAVPASRFHEQSQTLAAELAGEGLMIASGRERNLLAYLGAFNSKKRIQSVSRLGWLEDADDLLAYVLQNEAISRGNKEDIEFQPERYSPTSSSLRSAGTLEEWQEKIASKCQGNPLLTFAFCAGFAGVLLKFLGLDSGGFHLFGTTSRGKTTALQVAASVFGNGADPAHHF